MANTDDSPREDRVPRLSPSSAETLRSTEDPSSGLDAAGRDVDAATSGSTEDGREGLSAARSSVALKRGDRVARFTVLEKLGQGGMGVVYSAYDDILDRRVAIKLVHERRADARWQARILREAKALARLSHPNVVQIYEAGEYGHKIYLAMELIRGVTLREWLRRRRVEAGRREGPPGQAKQAYQDILRCFERAGRGLAAAHGVGLVHRDFKPDNVLVGDDGRVCVVDFGLVSGSASDHEDEAVSGIETSVLAERLRALDPDLTVEGSIMGTVSYMSPEQLDGRPTDDLSDQYSFCVALYEALYGSRPFAGATVEEMRSNVRSGRRAPAVENRAVSTLVRSAIERGLRVEPSARWPSLTELLNVLSHDPSRRRRRLFAAGSVVALACLAFFASQAAERHAEAQCLDLGEVVVVDWDGARPEVEDVFLSSDSPIGADTWSRVETSLDTWSQQWSQARSGACLAVRRGEEFGARKELCLDAQLVEFRGLLGALKEVDRGGIGNAVRATAKLPRVATCQSPSWLLLSAEPAADEAKRAMVEDARVELARARGYLYTGAYPRGLELVSDVLDRDESELDDAVRAEALLLSSRFLRKSGDFERATQEAKAAFFLAGRIGHDRVATEASIVLLGITSAELGEPGSVERWRPFAEMLLARLGLDREMLAGTYHLALGAGYRSSGAYVEAAAHYERAREIYAATLGAHDPALAQVENNLGTLREVQGDKEGALVHLRRGLEIASAALGPDHPDVATYLGNISTTYMMMEEYEKSIEYGLRGLAIEEQTYDANHPQIGISLLTLSMARDLLGNEKEALVGYERAATIFREHYGEEHPNYAVVLIGIANIRWSEGAHEEALATYERVVAIYEGLEGASVENHASALFSLAQALAEVGRDLARARALAERSLELYRSMGEYRPAAADTVEEWLQEHPARAP